MRNPPFAKPTRNRTTQKISNRIKYLSLSLLSIGSLLFSPSSPAILVSDADPVVLYSSTEDFDTIKENIETAITNRGLLVSGTLHVSDMLNRTGKDLGFPEPLYIKAESLEFCSALVSHRMTQADPVNLTMCPFTIAVYVKTSEPQQVYVAFRKPILAGEAQTVTAAIQEMLHSIIKEALDE